MLNHFLVFQRQKLPSFWNSEINCLTILLEMSLKPECPLLHNNYHFSSNLLQLFWKGIANIPNTYLNSELVNQMNKVNTDNVVLLSLPVSSYSFMSLSVLLHRSFINLSCFLCSHCLFWSVLPKSGHISVSRLHIIWT